MKTWLMVFFASLLLGTAFTGSSYFVTSEEDIAFQCYIDPATLPPNINLAATYSIYKVTKNGFPFAFYAKESAPKDDGCESMNKVHMKGVEPSNFYKEEFAKDTLIYTSVFFVLGAFLFGVRKKK